MEEYTEGTEVQNENETTYDFEDDFVYNPESSPWVKVATVGGSMLIGALAAKVIDHFNIPEKIRERKAKREAKKLEKMELKLAELRAKYASPEANPEPEKASKK